MASDRCEICQAAYTPRIAVASAAAGVRFWPISTAAEETTAKRRSSGDILMRFLEP